MEKEQGEKINNTTPHPPQKKIGKTYDSKIILSIDYNFDIPTEITGDVSGL